MESAEADADAATRGNALDETWLPIQSKFYLYLSGTPFRALNSGEFIEEQVFNRTYSDEQAAKGAWVGSDNPYESLPRMVLMTYKVPDSITRIARQGEFDEFDLNVFFSAEGHGADARFKYKEYVQKWLDLIRGSSAETAVDDLRMGAEKPPMPFSDTRLLGTLTHTLWFLPNVASCEAMANLLAERQNTFFHDYKVIVAAGSAAGMGVEAVGPVRQAMDDPLATKTITLSCGKLTTGVTVKPWSGVLMLRNLKSPETYFQTAFRVQSPWTTKTEAGETEILKRECYVFDFALDRALAMVSDYSCRLSVSESSPERKVAEFIKFLPVLAYDGSAMREVNAAEILDIAMAGTSATLLARRWESALLVCVDNDTLRRLLASDEAMRALMNIEGFRSLNADIETIINKSEAVKKAKKEKQNLTPKEKKQLSEEEKEFKNKRKQIQEKLIKFATRIPVFMYLTDYREQRLKDVITQLEPGLFKKVTGLSVKDFELLVSLGVFRDSVMNDAVYKFRLYEDASLEYTGLNRHEYDSSVGLFDTALSTEDYAQMKLQDSLLNPDGTTRDRDNAMMVTSEVMDAGGGSANGVAPKKRVQILDLGGAGDAVRAGGTKPAETRGKVPAKRDWVYDVLADEGLELIDARGKDGCLWVVGGGELDAKMDELENQGARFEFSLRGSKATGGRSAWWLKGYPEMTTPEWNEPPAVTQEKLDALEPGDTVFHKAFGYGEVVDVDRERGTIEVVIGLDKKGKPAHRKFLFPNVFEQGLLTV